MKTKIRSLRFVPYCTSDSWSGTRGSLNDMFSFMGAEIVLQVVRDLVPLGLENASSLLLAGSSAGGTGVMLNLDHVHNLVHHDLGKDEFFFSLSFPLLCSIKISSYLFMNYYYSLI